MSAVQARRPRRLEQPPPAADTVEMTLRGASRDVDAAIAEMRALGLVVRHAPDHPYPDRDGVSIRRRVVLDRREKPGRS
ncbi:hypothetical protein ACFY4C_21095 [Actinomadura viridis]|uniref:hypothetical protein n=1 Tax=Actinomadura viridis TaxID=58110 RepID=UPI003686A365